MKIGVDLDEVLVKFSEGTFNYYNSIHGTDYNNSQLKDYCLWKVWGGTKDDAIELVYDFYDSDLFDKIEAVEGAIEGINHLAQKHELSLITGRQFDFTEKTMKCIDKYFPGKFSEIYFMNDYSKDGGKSRKKSDVCVELGVDLLIEDVTSYTEGCNEKGIEVMLLNYPWNQEYVPGAIRVDSWKEIIEKIEL